MRQPVDNFQDFAQIYECLSQTEHTYTDAVFLAFLLFYLHAKKIKNKKNRNDLPINLRDIVD